MLLASVVASIRAAVVDTVGIHRLLLASSVKLPPVVGSGGGALGALLTIRLRKDTSAYAVRSVMLLR